MRDWLFGCTLRWAYTQIDHAHIPLKLLYFLADSFIAAFGITRPTEKARSQAAWFILSLMVLTLFGVAAAGVLIRSAVR